MLPVVSSIGVSVAGGVVNWGVSGQEFTSVLPVVSSIGVSQGRSSRLC